MGFKIVIGLILTVIVGMVVAKQNETAGGAAFLVGLLLTGVWAARS